MLVDIHFNAILSNNRLQSPFIKKRKGKKDREHEFDYLVILCDKRSKSFFEKEISINAI